MQPEKPDEWKLPKPRNLGWNGLTDAELKEQAQVTTNELLHTTESKLTK